MPTDTQIQMRSLVDLSARLGHDPLFVQASTGNTSVKIDGTLWIKSSGTWLADAGRSNILVPVNLAEALECLGGKRDPPLREIASDFKLRASIETPVHAVLSHRVVIHVHSINAVAWAIRADAPDRLATLLSGMQWRWIPYVSSGGPLANAIRDRVTRETIVLVLGNHGLIVCGETCEAAENTLREVERRLAITPSSPTAPDYNLLAEIAASGPWRFPEDLVLHVLGTDPSGRSVLAGGILYPCQAIFWHTTSTALFTAIPPQKLLDGAEPELMSRPFLIIEGCGVLIRQGMDRGDYAILRGLAHVIQRICSSTPIHYLSELDLADLTVTSGNYRAIANRASSV